MRREPAGVNFIGQKLTGASRVTIQEILVKANSAQFPFLLLKWWMASLFIFIICVFQSWRRLFSYRKECSGHEYKTMKALEPDTGLLVECIVKNIRKWCVISGRVTLCLCAKKVVSDGLRLVDFATGQVNSVLNLPNMQFKFF